MEFKASNENRILANQKIEKGRVRPKASSIEDPSRRKALKMLAFLGVAAATVPKLKGAEKFLESFGSGFGKDDPADEAGSVHAEAKPAVFESEQEQADNFDIENIREENLSTEEKQAIESLFSFNGTIDLDMEKRNLLLKSWREKYSSHILYKRELEKAYLQINGYRETLEKFFLELEVPPYLVDLSIPESYARSKAKSHKGAVGAYQFTKPTGRQYGLLINERFDERTDPVKSGKACAKFLKDLFRELGDWDLALYGYNGGFARRYAKEEKSCGKKPSEAGFLEYMEKIIKKIRNEVKSQPHVEYKVRSGDSLFSIAKKHSADLEKIRVVNGIRNVKSIKTGDIIKIPLTQKNREEIYQKRIAGIVENLNYVAKCRAVFELIEEGKKA